MGLLFHLENGSSTFLRYISDLPDYTVSSQKKTFFMVTGGRTLDATQFQVPMSMSKRMCRGVWCSRHKMAWTNTCRCFRDSLPKNQVILGKRVRKMINKVKWRCEGTHPTLQWSGVKWSKLWWGCEGYVSEMKWSMWRVRKYSEVECKEGHDEMWMHQFMKLHISLLLLFSV
jgi:hypothetical protein